MIFVTVGTHEQPMDRLFAELERLCAVGLIAEEVFVQYGYSDFKFEKCRAIPMLPFAELMEKMRTASQVICHGGPATIMQARVGGQSPILVPRQHRFGEHVNDHQVDFCRRLTTQPGAQYRLVLEMAELGKALGDMSSALVPGSERLLDGSQGRKAIEKRLLEFTAQSIPSRA